MEYLYIYPIISQNYFFVEWIIFANFNLLGWGDKIPETISQRIFFFFFHINNFVSFSRFLQEETHKRIKTIEEREREKKKPLKKVRGVQFFHRRVV